MMNSTSPASTEPILRYQHAGVTIYHGDSRALSQVVEPESVDLTVTSSPYWEPQKIRYDRELFPTYQAWLDVMAEVARQLYLVHKPGSVLAWNIAPGARGADGLYHYKSKDIAVLLEAAGFTWWYEIVWVKPDVGQGGFGTTIQNPYRRRMYFNRIHEVILLYTRGDVAAPDYPEPLDMELARAWHTDVWWLAPEIKIAESGRNLLGEHGGSEAPFPLTIPLAFIEFFLPAEGLGLDPFMGTGTSLLAARLAIPPRRFVGVDIMESSVKTAIERVGAMRMRPAEMPKKPTNMTQLTLWEAQYGSNG